MTSDGSFDVSNIKRSIGLLHIPDHFDLNLPLFLQWVSYSQITDTHDNISKGGKNFLSRQIFNLCRFSRSMPVKLVTTRTYQRYNVYMLYHSYFIISITPIYVDPDYNSPLIYWWGYCNLSVFINDKEMYNLDSKPGAYFQKEVSITDMPIRNTYTLRTTSSFSCWSISERDQWISSWQWDE